MQKLDVAWRLPEDGETNLLVIAIIGWAFVCFLWYMLASKQTKEAAEAKDRTEPKRDA